MITTVNCNQESYSTIICTPRCKCILNEDNSDKLLSDGTYTLTIKRRIEFKGCDK